MTRAGDVLPCLAAWGAWDNCPRAQGKTAADIEWVLAEHVPPLGVNPCKVCVGEGRDGFGPPRPPVSDTRQTEPVSHEEAQ